MGLYRRTWRRKDGKIVTTPIWWMAYVVDGKQHCQSTGTNNKKLAQKILNKKMGEIVEGRFELPKSNVPGLEEFSQEFLNSVRHANTKKRYSSSVGNLLVQLGNIRLTNITAEQIELFKTARLNEQVRAATVNRDLAVLRRMLNIAERRRLITKNIFREVELLEERKERRQPHILTFEEESKLLAFAPGHIRLLVILILETGLRSRLEAMALNWRDVDFANEVIRIRHSKSPAGVRNVPMSSRCKVELLKWNEQLGPEFSEHIFASPRNCKNSIKDVRRSWAKTLKDASIEAFWIYDLRHTFASRLTEAGVSPLFVAQIMGHSSPNILQTYAKAIDEYRRSAIAKLEALRENKITDLDKPKENAALLQ